jgi:hypothetical protein
MDPPPLHWPDSHVLGAVQFRPEQDPVAHWVPSLDGLQTDGSIDTAQTWQALSDRTAPSAKHSPPIWHHPAATVWVHPAAVQASSVHAFPSSQDWTAPPAVHWPDRQLFAAMKVSPSQVPAPHEVPSSKKLQAVWFWSGRQDWQKCVASASPAARHVPAIRQDPVCTGCEHVPSPRQMSSVQALPSSQENAVPWQSMSPLPPSVHRSAFVQASPSSHALPAL